MDTMSQQKSREKLLTDQPWHKVSIGVITFALGVIIPTLIYLFYILIIASPQYETEFRIQIRSPNGNAVPSFGQLFGLSGMSTPASENGYAVTQYLASVDAIEDLERTVGLRSRYRLPTIDGFSRLSENTSKEQLLRYWKRRLTTYFEPTTGTVVVQISAFSPTDSLAISRQALKLSEALLNRMSHRARTDSVRYAEHEVRTAEEKLRILDRQLLQARNRARIVDVSKQVSASIMRISELQREVDKAQAEVNVRRRYLSDGTPGREAAEAQLRAVQSALSAAQAGMAGTATGPSRSLAGAINVFDALEGQKVFAEKRLQAALTSLNAAQSDAVRQQLYLDTIVRPSRPEEPAYPRPFTDSLQFFGFATAGWALLLILGLSIRDHIGA